MWLLFGVPGHTQFTLLSTMLGPKIFYWLMCCLCCAILILLVVYGWPFLQSTFAFFINIMNMKQPYQDIALYSIAAAAMCLCGCCCYCCCLCRRGWRKLRGKDKKKKKKDDDDDDDEEDDDK